MLIFRLNLRKVATIIACLAVTTMFSGCNKDTTNPEKTNYFTYDGKTFEIKMAIYHEEDDFYAFVISSTESISKAPNICLEIPKSLMGQKLDLTQSYPIPTNGHFLCGYFFYNEEYFPFAHNNSGLTGTDNWVKITKNSGSSNFTLEFNMTIDGKLLSGKYIGRIEKDFN